MSNARQALDAATTAPLLPLFKQRASPQIIDHFINAIDPLQTLRADSR